MHDPDVVVFDIYLPIPSSAWTWPSDEGVTTLRRRRRTNPENLGQPIYPWWQPGAWEVVVAGHRLRLYKAATVWHHEPNGRDSGTVCKGRRDLRWALEHRRHLRVQWLIAGNIRAWQRDRCEACGHRFAWKEARIGTGWDAPGVLHGPCGNLRHVTRQHRDALAVIAGTADETTRWRVGRAVDFMLGIHDIDGSNP